MNEFFVSRDKILVTGEYPYHEDSITYAGSRDKSLVTGRHLLLFVFLVVSLNA